MHEFKHACMLACAHLFMLVRMHVCDRHLFMLVIYSCLSRHLFMLVRMHVCDMTEDLCADGGRRARRISEVQHASPREDSGGSSIFTRIPRVLQEGRCARRAVVSLFPSIDPVERSELSGTPSRSCPRWIFGCELAIDDIGRFTRDSLRTDSVSPISPSLSPYLSSYLFQTPPPPPRLPLGNQHPDSPWPYQPCSFLPADVQSDQAGESRRALLGKSLSHQRAGQPLQLRPLWAHPPTPVVRTREISHAGILLFATIATCVWRGVSSPHTLR